MATTATTTMDKHIVGYDSYIAANWNTLEQWERDAYQIWTAASRGKAKPLKTKTQRNASVLPRTVVLAYLLLVFGTFVAPLHLDAAALALGVINMGRGRAGHGFVQVALSLAALALYTTGYAVNWESIIALQDRFTAGV